MKDIYDVVIIGAGPAGLTASLYSCRARLKTLLLEKTSYGGQVLVTDVIENFPGFPNGIKGPELADHMLKQAEHFGIKAELRGAKEIILQKDKSFKIRVSDGKEVEAVSVIIATGAMWNSLNIPGEKELTGRGVSYCATCDGPLFKGKNVVVVGGGNTAIEDALFLTRFAREVTVVHRRSELRATKILQERAMANSKMKFRLNSIALGVVGKNKVEGLRIKNIAANKEEELSADGIFVLIGITPNSSFVKGFLKLDEKGYILCDDEMRTSVDGVFACGDARKKSLRQIVTAAGDGATAAFSAERYVGEVRGTAYK